MNLRHSTGYYTTQNVLSIKTVKLCAWFPGTLMHQSFATMAPTGLGNSGGPGLQMTVAYMSEAQTFVTVLQIYSTINISLVTFVRVFAESFMVK